MFTIIINFYIVVNIYIYLVNCMFRYTIKTMRKIAEFFDESDKTMELLFKYGEAIEEADHYSKLYLDSVLKTQRVAYEKRQRGGYPNSLAIIENEIEALKGLKGENLSGYGHVRRKKTLSQLDTDWDNM